MLGAAWRTGSSELCSLHEKHANALDLFGRWSMHMRAVHSNRKAGSVERAHCLLCTASTPLPKALFPCFGWHTRLYLVRGPATVGVFRGRRSVKPDRVPKEDYRGVALSLVNRIPSGCETRNAANTRVSEATKPFIVAIAGTDHLGLNACHTVELKA